MRSTYCVRAVLSIVIVFGFAASTSAQNAPAAEFSAGWRLLNFPNALGGDSQTLPLGWYADVAGNLTPAIAGRRRHSILTPNSGRFVEFPRKFG